MSCVQLVASDYTLRHPLSSSAIQGRSPPFLWQWECLSGHSDLESTTWYREASGGVNLRVGGLFFSPKTLRRLTIFIGSVEFGATVESNHAFQGTCIEFLKLF